MRHVQCVLAFVAILLGVGCVPQGAPAEGQRAGGGRPDAPPQSPTLVMVLRSEPPSVASKPLRAAGLSVASATRLFNAELDYVDDRGTPHPYLAEALPQLNTDSWRVFPDGRMETSYRLKPEVTWHDGTPLRAGDFAFALEVYRTPELGASDARPISLMEQILAPDDRMVVIRWRNPYPEADALGMGFQALPRHILEQPFQQAEPEALLSHPYWSGAYVGPGPYRLERWEPGAFIEAVAFDRHVLGRPMIDRVRLLFMSDANIVLASLLSEAAHIAVDNSLKYEQAAILQREWAPRNGGVVLLSPSQWRSTEVQLRPELATPSTILDVRVRRALLHAMDRDLLNQTLLGGQGMVADTPISPLVAYYPAIERAITTYPYDLRRTEQLLLEAGLARRPNGLFAHPNGEAFKPGLWTLSGAQNEAELAILVDGFRRAGVEVSPYVIPAAQISDRRVRSTFPALSSTSGGGGEGGLVGLRSAPPGPENQGLGGGGRGGWANSEFDRLVDGFNRTLDRAERTQQVVDMARIYSEQLPKLPHYFNVRVTAHVAALKGPLLSTTPDAGSESWNAHQWEWR